jgi:hypothetical protein
VCVICGFPESVDSRIMAVSVSIIMLVRSDEFTLDDAESSISCTFDIWLLESGIAMYTELTRV